MNMSTSHTIPKPINEDEADEKEAHENPMVELLRNYDDLNGPTITELHALPSALEFMRHVALNRPFVVRRAVDDWEAVARWDIPSLKEALKGEKVNVAVTPLGNADSPIKNEDGDLVFVKPWEEEQDFAECVDFIARQEKDKHSKKATQQEVRYCQTQNDNLRNEYSVLSSHVSPSPPFARIALQREPEAINLWIGNSLSVTALHKDNYENLYVQVLGKKHFVLLPPVAYVLVQEKELRPATYVRQDDGGLKMIMDQEGDKVPFATWDPDDPDAQGLYAGLLTPMRVTLEPGDMLYLPTMWYHKVSQSCSEEGICCAVNYWYDMDFSGSFYPLCNFVRSVVLDQNRRGT